MRLSILSENVKKIKTCDINLNNSRDAEQAKARQLKVSDKKVKKLCYLAKRRLRYTHQKRAQQHQIL